MARGEGDGGSESDRLRGHCHRDLDLLHSDQTSESGFPEPGAGDPDSEPKRQNYRLLR